MKKTRKTTRLISGMLSALILTTVLAGCSADKSDDYNYSRSSNEYTTSEDYYNSASPGLVAGSPQMNDAAYDKEGYGSAQEQTSSSGTISEFESKVIKNANLTMEALDVDKAYMELLNYILSKGGTEFSRNMTNNKDKTTVYATFKVRPETLDEILRTASDFAEITSSNVSSSDITSSYYDYKIRLETKRKSLEKYYEYLSNADTIEEMIMLQNQIDYLTSDIEAFEGQLRMWDSLVSQSTISVTIYQADDPDEVEEEVIEWNTLTLSKVGRLMKNGFTKTCNAIFSVIQWLLVIIVSILPIVVLISIAVIIIVLISKSKKKKQQQNLQQLPDKTDQN